MSLEAFERFRVLVLGDPDLQDELRAVGDHEPFVSRVVELGRERGLDFDGADVEEAMNLARRTWLERWL